MEKVIRYKCEKCGKLFENEAKCIQHEDRHLRVGKANEMLEAGHSILSRILQNKTPFLNNLRHANAYRDYNTNHLGRRQTFQEHYKRRKTQWI